MMIEMRGASAPKKGRGPRARWLATASLALAALFTVGSARAVVLLTDGFEGAQQYGNPPTFATTYSSHTPVVQATNARSGSNSLLFDDKEGVLYTLTDTYQVGTYDVSYWIKRDTYYGITLSLLTYDYVSGYSGANVLAVAYKTETWNTAESPSNVLPQGSYFQVTMTTTVAPGDAAIGKTIQFLAEQSRNGNYYNMYMDDLTITYTPVGGGGGGDVPEPGSLALLALGAVGLTAVRRRRSWH